MNNMMSTEYLDEVVMSAQGKAQFWIDTAVPVHLRSSLIEGDHIYLGNVNMIPNDQFNLLR